MAHVNDRIVPWTEESADLYEFLFASSDNARHADQVHDLIQVRSPEARSLLDVACGTGWHLERLGSWYEVEGLDLSPAMLARARARLPDARLQDGDMRSFDLCRTFDAVICLSSSIAWMQSPSQLEEAVATMARHLAPGGILIVEPWDFPGGLDVAEPWVTSVETPDRKVAVIETTTLAGDHWLQRMNVLDWTPRTGARHLIEEARLGAFTRKDYVRAFDRARLGVEFDEVGLLGRGLFIATSAPDDRGLHADPPTIVLDDFALTPVNEDAVPLLVRWLSDPRVFEFYMSDNDPRTEDAVREEFLAEDDVEGFIVRHEGSPIGYLQFYEVAPEWRDVYGVSEDEAAHGMDEFIGEPDLWGRGLGSSLVHQVADYLVRDRGASRVFLDPHVDNHRAIRVYERAGFRKVRLLPEHEMREGRLRDAWLMEYKA